MKKAIIFCMLAISSITMYAQSPFKKGDKVLDIGIGLGNPYWGGGTTSSLPVNPRIGLESWVTDDISIGGSVAMSSSKYEYNYFGSRYGWKYNGYFIAGRGAYHFSVNQKVDPYIGASLGYVIVTVKDLYPENTDGTVTSVGSGVGYGAFAGVRYFLKPKFALNAELGYSSFSFLTVGVSLKL